MTESGPTPIRIYREFTKRDWPELPQAAQDALASFLMKLQKNPFSTEIIAHVQKDSLGRLGFEFSPGYEVYWRIITNEFETVAQSVRIEVLAVLQTGIKFTEAEKEAPTAGDSSITEQQDLIERAYSRSTTLGALSMWGTLHTSRRTGRAKGWIVDSWSQGGPPYLKPKMHWMSVPDYKLHHMQLNIDFRSTMQVGSEDTETEPERLVFVRATVKQWEQDWIEGQSTKTS
jgi:hypothetical protein